MRTSAGFTTRRRNCRRGFGYVSAAGRYAFENRVANTELDSYGSGLWWTAMLLTSIGSETFPKTA